MNRRDIIVGTGALGAAMLSSGQAALAEDKADCGMPELAPPEKPAELNLCLRWSKIPGREIDEKLDFLEEHGFAAVEIPSGNWPITNCEAMKKAMKGRDLFIATACGPSDFSHAAPKKREAEVARFLPVIEALGAMNAVGLILCPARKKPGMGHAELREDFVTNTGRRLAEHAARHGTSIVLEPLRRNETPFLRQVADGARIAADIGPGAAVMGDFWHMQLEETSFMGAFICGGDLLKHVHIAGLRRRIIPGCDPADVYVDGFKGLKLIGYRGAISFEGGWPRNPANPKKKIPQKERIRLIGNMVRLLREQWAMA